MDWDAARVLMVWPLPTEADPGAGEVVREACFSDRVGLLHNGAMRVLVSLLPVEGLVDRSTDVAVVIDVLRATSVMATALASGAERLITCAEIEEARSLAQSLSPPPLLCGERGCRPIAGFDLGNSPAEYTAARISGQTLVLTTTNGTAAIEVARQARHVITASFLNLSAVVASLRDANQIHLICAGTNRTITNEDVLLAGAIAGRLEDDCGADLVGDEADLARQFWRASGLGEAMRSRLELSRRLARSQGGRNLVREGYEDDLTRCAAVDSVAIVPQRIAVSPPTFAV